VNTGLRFLLCTAVAAVFASGVQAESLWEKRAEQERQWRAQGLTLIPHQANYFFPFTYNTSPHSSSLNRAQHKEAKFQVSFKVLLMNNIASRNAHLYFGYTQLSLWQIYDQNRSAPFRDTNYEPELILRVDTEQRFDGITMRHVDFGLSHQSNGVSVPDSRSWNRAYMKFYFDKDDYSFSIKLWVRLPDGGRDDNHDIYKYMGFAELTGAYVMKNHVISIMVRNNLRLPKNRGAVQLDYHFPLTRILTGLVQYFNGYGESLLDYNRPNNRISIGLALSDWH
jgi:phospholipase A1